MPELVDRLEAKLQRYLLDTMPPDSSGELEELSLADLLLVYGNWRTRFIPHLPRKLHIAPELQADEKYDDFRIVLDHIAHLIEDGGDLTPHLSRGVKIAYVPKAQAPQQLKRRRDLDLLISDWGIHHLHLTTEIEHDGFVKRTDDLLFGAFTLQDAFLIGIYPHGNWGLTELVRIVVRNWPDSGLFTKMSGVSLVTPISDEERLQARQGGVMQPVEVDGDLFMPPGLTIAGTPISVTSKVNALMGHLREWRKDVDSRLPRRDRENRFLYWLPAIQDRYCGFKARRHFIPVGELP